MANCGDALSGGGPPPRPRTVVILIAPLEAALATARWAGIIPAPRGLATPPPRSAVKELPRPCIAPPLADMAPRADVAPRAGIAPRAGMDPRVAVGMTPRPPRTICPRPLVAIVEAPPLMVLAPRIAGLPRVFGIPLAPRTAEAIIRPLEAGVTPLIGEPRVFTGEGLATVLVGVDIGDLLATGVIFSWLGCGWGEGIRCIRFCII